MARARKLIKFRRLSRKPQILNRAIRAHGIPEFDIPTRTFIRPVKVFWWEIAFSEDHLFAKLDGEMAEVIMPPKHLFVRIWRRFFPLKGIECELNTWYELSEGE